MWAPVSDSSTHIQSPNVLASVTGRQLCPLLLPSEDPPGWLVLSVLVPGHNGPCLLKPHTLNQLSASQRHGKSVL